jgi:hypothetical protein
MVSRSVMMAAAVQSHHSRLSIRRKFARISFEFVPSGWSRILGLGGCNNHRLKSTPSPRPLCSGNRAKDRRGPLNLPKSYCTELSKQSHIWYFSVPRKLLKRKGPSHYEEQEDSRQWEMLHRARLEVPVWNRLVTAVRFRTGNYL